MECHVEFHTFTTEYFSSSIESEKHWPSELELEKKWLYGLFHHAYGSLTVSPCSPTCVRNPLLTTPPHWGICFITTLQYGLHESQKGLDPLPFFTLFVCTYPHSFPAHPRGRQFHNFNIGDNTIWKLQGNGHCFILFRERKWTFQIQMHLHMTIAYAGTWEEREVNGLEEMQRNSFLKLFCK